MKLTNQEFRRFKELMQKKKSGKITSEEQTELDALSAKKNEKGSNDVKWWMNYPSLAKDATNIAFNWIPGTEVPITGFQAASSRLELGVIAVAEMIDTIGRSRSDADAFNSQIRQLWLDMHRKYRGIGQYQKSDLGIAILAINSYFETIAKFERIYGVINSYKIGNRVVPKGLKEALHIGGDLEENLADFRYTLNLFIEKAKQLCLPRGLSALESDIVTISNVFADSKDRRAFLFCFDTRSYGVYDPIMLTDGGCVKYVDFSNHMNGLTPNNAPGFTLSDVQAILNDMLDSLINDDDIAKMCSDLLAAYGPDNVLQLNSVPADYTLDPVLDYERLVQFHNLTICRNAAGVYDAADIDATLAATLVTNKVYHVIYQHDNVIKCELGCSSSSYNYVTIGSQTWPYLTNLDAVGKEADVVVDTWIEDPKDVELLCGTRFSAICGAPAVVATNQYTQPVYSFGTKVVTHLSVFAYDNSGVYKEYSVYGSVVDVAHFKYNYLAFTRLLQMDWAPTIYINDGGDLHLFGDIDNFAVVNYSNLNRLHEVCLLSGFKVPMVASYDK